MSFESSQWISPKRNIKYLEVSNINIIYWEFYKTFPFCSLALKLRRDIVLGRVAACPLVEYRLRWQGSSGRTCQDDAEVRYSSETKNVQRSAEMFEAISFNVTFVCPQTSCHFPFTQTRISLAHVNVYLYAHVNILSCTSLPMWQVNLTNHIIPLR